MSLGADADVDLDLSGAVGLNITGIPNSFSFGVTTLPKIQIGVDKVQLGLDKIQLGLDKVQLGIDPLALSVDVKPIDFALRLKEIPSVRIHFPTNFKLGFSFFGSEFFSVRLCGQAQVITEPYYPNPCECPNPLLVDRPPSQPPTDLTHVEKG